jgi:hypothetical protein
MSLRVSAFPTFYFYVNGSKVDEIKGANPRSIEDKVIQYKTSGSGGFGGKGVTLGGGVAWDGVGKILTLHTYTISMYLNALTLS